MKSNSSDGALWQQQNQVQGKSSKQSPGLKDPAALSNPERLLLAVLRLPLQRSHPPRLEAALW
jgi:hypothetical protein